MILPAAGDRDGYIKGLLCGNVSNNAGAREVSYARLSCGDTEVSVALGSCGGVLARDGELQSRERSYQPVAPLA